MLNTSLEVLLFSYFSFDWKPLAKLPIPYNMFAPSCIPMFAMLLINPPLLWFLSLPKCPTYSLLNWFWLPNILLKLLENYMLDCSSEFWMSLKPDCYPKFWDWKWFDEIYFSIYYSFSGLMNLDGLWFWDSCKTSCLVWFLVEFSFLLREYWDG